MISKFVLILITVLFTGILGLIVTVCIQYRVFFNKLKKIEQDSINRMNKYNGKAQEILSDANDKKSSLHTGSDTDNFNNSLNILQNYSKKRNKANPN